MGIFRSSEGKGKAAPEPPPKYSYAQFLATGGTPSPAALSAAANYSTKAASSAALQAQIESSRFRQQKEVRRKRRCAPGRVWMHVLTVLQIAVAIGVIGVVAGCLNKQTEVTVADGSPPAQMSVCYATTRSVDICWYSYWAAACSIAVSLTISLFNICCPRRKVAFCLSIETVLGLVGAAWWCGSAIAELVLANEANAANLPYSTCRTVSWILCWVNAGLFTLSFLTSAAGCCAACCGFNDDDYDTDP